MDVATMFSALQSQLEDMRRQLELLTKDPKDLTVNQVVQAYLAAWPDDVCQQEAKERTRVLLRFANFCGPKRISETGAADLVNFIRSLPSTAAGCTHGRKMAMVKRVFNWALGERLIREFPFRAVKIPKGKRGGRPMTMDQFRALVRHTRAYFRRFVLFLFHTGCRPGEAASLRWNEIDWEQSRAILDKHKTAKKTGKPRVLVLNPVLIRLLRWLRARRPRRSTARWLAELLSAGPLTLRELNREARKAEISPRMVWKAKRSIGAELVRGDGKKQPARYVLKNPPRLPKEDDPSEFVFLSGRGRVWNKNSLSSLMRRLRVKRAIRTGTKLYGLRHRMATELVKKNVHPRVVASLLGHARTSTQDHYTTTVGEDPRLLLKEIEKLSTPHTLIIRGRQNEDN
jgi:integrase